MQMLKIAIDAVAESHTEGHDCDVCKAACGDQDAFGEDRTEGLRRGGGEMKAMRADRSGRPRGASESHSVASRGYGGCSSTFPSMTPGRMPPTILAT